MRVLVQLILKPLLMMLLINQPKHPDLPVATNVTVAGTVVTQATVDCLITGASVMPERVCAPSTHAYLGATAATADADADADAPPHNPSNNGNSSSVNHKQVLQ